jgi:hypothetical protein
VQILGNPFLQNGGDIKLNTLILFMISYDAINFSWRVVVQSFPKHVTKYYLENQFYDWK